MAIFKFVINDPEKRKSYQVEVDQSKVMGLIGKKIGEEFNGDVLGLIGYSLKITGGTDKDGFPMYPKVPGMVRKKILLSSPPGFHPKIKGQRKRKMIHGDTVSESIIQINCKITKKGEKPIEELITIKPKEKKEEKKIEEKPKPEEKPKIEEKKEIKEEKKIEEKPAEKKEEKPKEKPEEKTGGEKTNEQTA